MTGCSGRKTSSEEKASYSEGKTIFLDVPTSVETDADGNATIKGKTLPDSNVKIGLGIVGDSTKSNKEGDFTLEYKLQIEDKPSTIKITAKNDGKKTVPDLKLKCNTD
jgi:hypothetical protein